MARNARNSSVEPEEVKDGKDIEGQEEEVNEAEPKAEVADEVQEESPPTPSPTPTPTPPEGHTPSLPLFSSVFSFWFF